MSRFPKRATLKDSIDELKNSAEEIGEPGGEPGPLNAEGKLPNDQLHLGEVGGPAGPLDGGGKIPMSELPPLQHDVGEAADQAAMLALDVSAPAMCVRTDTTPPHIYFLTADPADTVDNWTDTGELGAGAADPTAKVGTTAVNGSSNFYMRADAAPAIDDSVVALVGGNSASATMDIGTTTDQDVRIVQDGSPLITVRGNGVGIAWPTPLAPLHIGGGIIIEAGSVQFEIDLSDGTQATIATANNHPLTFGTNNTTRFTIEGSGQLTAASGYTPTGAKSLAPKDYVDGAVFSGAYGDLTGAPIDRTSGTDQLQLDGEDLIWPSDAFNGKIRLYDSTPGSDNTFYGLGIANGALLYQVDSNTSVHRFQGVDGSDSANTILEMSTNSGIVASVDLHMGEQKVVNVGDPTNARDAVNLQTLDGRLSDAQRTAIDALTPSSTASEIVAALQAT